MTEYARERHLQKKREYYRKWRADHQESVKRSQAKYWARKLEEASLYTNEVNAEVNNEGKS